MDYVECSNFHNFSLKNFQFEDKIFDFLFIRFFIAVDGE